MNKRRWISGYRLLKVDWSKWVSRCCRNETTV